jgi:ATP-binding cassette subfamily B multidrug efflux pump
MRAIARIFMMVFRNHRRRLMFGYLTAIGAALSALAIPQALGRGVNDVLSREDTGLGLLLWFALALVLAGLARGVFAFAQTYFAESLSQRIAYELRNDYFDRLQHLSFAFHDQQTTGSLMSRATADVEGVRMFVNMGAVRVGFIVAIVVGVVIAMLLSDVTLGLISLAFIPFLGYRAVATSRLLRRTWRSVQELTGDMVAVLQENLTGIRVVKAFAAEEHEKQKFHRHSIAVADMTFKAESTWARNFSVMNFGFMLGIGAVLWVGGQRVIDSTVIVNGQVTYTGFTPGDLAAFFFYMTLLIMPVRMMGWTVNSFARAASSGERLFEILDTPSPVSDLPGAQEIGRAQGHVAFNDVSFSYDGINPALKHVTVDVEAGSTVALVGRPGSGKTTFAHLIPRFYDATDGQVLLDGADVRELTLFSLRRNVGVVQQDVFIHTASIRDNVAYGNADAALDEVQNMARLAQMDGFINEMPDRYETVVGERGIGLSGGQKQRLSIARTLLLDPPVLVLDDSTSSVDVHTERLIQQSLEQVMANRTTFIITNRFSSIASADLILVFEDGEITQRGTHVELLAAGGEYRELYESQVRPGEGSVRVRDQREDREAAR